MNAWSDFIFPDEKGFKGTILDNYLAAGYYRTQHLLFTTHLTQISNEQKTYPVFWLRMPIKSIIENAAATSIRKKCAAFAVLCNKAKINIGINELYNNYIKGIDFEEIGRAHV